MVTPDNSIPVKPDAPEFYDLNEMLGAENYLMYRSGCALECLETLNDGKISNTEDLEHTVTTLLADLRHLCDLKGVDFSALDRRGRDTYQSDLGREAASK